MTEERVTERVDATGKVTERTIERGSPTTVIERRGGGGGSAIMIFLLVALLAVGAYFLINANSSETRKDAAVAEAAREVGDSAKKIGDSAEKAVDNLTK